MVLNIEGTVIKQRLVFCVPEVKARIISSLSAVLEIGEYVRDA